MSSCVAKLYGRNGHKKGQEKKFQDFRLMEARNKLKELL